MDIPHNPDDGSIGDDSFDARDQNDRADDSRDLALPTAGEGIAFASAALGVRQAADKSYGALRLARALGTTSKLLPERHEAFLSDLVAATANLRPLSPASRPIFEVFDRHLRTTNPGLTTDELVVLIAFSGRAMVRAFVEWAERNIRRGEGGWINPGFRGNNLDEPGEG
ncbi:MAG: hypothetical protein ACT4PL_03600 [Phycisphaerales bacterium]